MFFSLARPRNSAVSLSNSSSIRSAGRQVMACAPSSTRVCSSLLKGAMAAPYSPFNTPAVSLVMVLYRSPVKTLSTAWVPTICEVGVTRGIKPRSSRTRGISASTSSSLSAAPCSFNWLSMLVSMPPGTWATRIRESTPLREPSHLAYFLRTSRK